MTDELKANFETAHAKLTESLGKCTVFVNHVMAGYEHMEEPCEEWRVSVIWGIAERCELKYGTDFKIILADLLDKLNGLPKFVNPCKVCGGRMEGPCKHTHEGGGE